METVTSTSKEVNINAQKQLAVGQAGFTLIEVICAIAVLTIGLIGTAAAITTAWKYQIISRNITEAKSILLGQIEEIHSLRDSRRLKFKQIDNVSTIPAPTSITGRRVDFDGFLDGFQPIYDSPGADGVFGTPDDSAGGGAVREGFKRKIEIVTAADSIKKVTVTIQYPGPDGQVYTIDCISFLNNDLKQ